MRAVRKAAGRGHLIAVSKTVAPEFVELAVRAGAGDLGENYVQEAQTKIETLGRAARWHMIGHLQTNKASRAALLFDMVQSVDSPRLARKLSDAAVAAGKRLEVLIEVNISGEEAKTGVAKCEALSLAAEAAALPGLALKGLMAIPPFLDDPTSTAAFQGTPRDVRNASGRAAPGAFDGDVRGLRGGNRGRRDDGEGRNGDIWLASGGINAENPKRASARDRRPSLCRFQVIL